MTANSTQSSSWSRKRQNEGTDSTIKRSKIQPSESFADLLKGMTVQESNTDLWARSTSSFTNDESIIFQHLDIRESTTPDGELIIQLFGSTKEGETVLACVTGFLPYFYFPSPSNFTEDDLDPLTEYLNELSRELAVEKIELVAKHPGGSKISSPFLKISTTTISTLRTILDEHPSNSLEQYRNLFINPERTFEANTGHTLRFMLDTQIPGMSWVKIPAKKYDIVSEHDKLSSCQVEFFVRYDHLIPLPGVGNWSRNAPLRILSFDIETQTQMERFSDPTMETVYQIANMVTYRDESEPFIRAIFTLGTCSPIEGSRVSSYKTESQMLRAWQEFVLQVDPDVITGYNIARFDVPYLITRAETLGLDGFYLGRLHGVKTAAPTLKDRSEWKHAPILPGRMYLDMLHFLWTNMQLDCGYKLDAVAKHFLGQKKEDVKLSDINKLQNGTAETRRQLAIYCAKDAYLPIALLRHLRCLEKNATVVRQEFLCFNSLLTLNDRLGSKPFSNPLRIAVLQGHVFPDPL